MFIAVFAAVATVIAPLQTPSAHAARRDRQEPGTLIVKKAVEGVSSGSYDVTDFWLSVHGSKAGALSRFDDDGENEYEWLPGPYFVSENAPEGWTVTYGGDCDENGKITIISGGEVTCIITNTFQGGVGGAVPDSSILLIEKVRVGGSASYDDFSFSLDEEPYSFWDAGWNSYEVPAGEHTVIEEPAEGYAPTYGGDCDENGNVTITSGEILTCTVTNTYAVGGFNPEGEPTDDAGEQPAADGIGISGDDGVSQDPLVGESGEESGDTMASDSEEFGTAAIGGSLAGFVPCGAGGIGWLLVNIVLLVIIFYFWKDRRSAHWLATILLVAVALFMNSWASSCALPMAWLPALLALVTWLLMKLLGKPE